jgi:GPR1/FUN34/yaaH family
MFGVYGGWFLTYGAVLTPSFNAVAAYADPTNPKVSPATSTAFLASLGMIT